jgi:hypothetical protein
MLLLRQAPAACVYHLEGHKGSPAPPTLALTPADTYMSNPCIHPPPMPPLLPHTTHTNTHTQVRAVADRFIYDQDIAIAAVGDVQFLPDYSWFRRRTYWIRY